MKKLMIFVFVILLISCRVSAAEQAVSAKDNVQPEVSTVKEEPRFVMEEQAKNVVDVFSNGKYFGLKNTETDEIIVEAKYLKLVRVGKTGWIVQKKNKFGLMDSDGKFLIEPEFRHVDRILGRYIKIGNDSDFGIYDEHGNQILPPIYNSIDLLYGKMFLTYKNFRYGVSDFNGNTLIANICDDIYMPSKNVMKIKYLGTWYEIDDVSVEKLTMPETITDMKKNTEFKVTDIVADTGAISGYSLLTFSDYLIKIVSSISPAHEETIDDLILSHGVDTVDIVRKFSWIPKYPVTFAKKYYIHVRNPFNGPLTDIRYSLKNKI